jgi:hypothetical protein
MAVSVVGVVNGLPVCAGHVLGDGRLSDRKAELEQIAAMRGAPELRRISVRRPASTNMGLPPAEE